MQSNSRKCSKIAQLRETAQFENIFMNCSVTINLITNWIFGPGGLCAPPMVAFASEAVHFAMFATPEKTRLGGFTSDLSQYLLNTIETGGAISCFTTSGLTIARAALHTLHTSNMLPGLWTEHNLRHFIPSSSDSHLHLPSSGSHSAPCHILNKQRTNRCQQMRLIFFNCFLFKDLCY